MCSSATPDSFEISPITPDSDGMPDGMPDKLICLADDLSMASAACEKGPLPQIPPPARQTQVLPGESNGANTFRSLPLPRAESPRKVLNGIKNTNEFNTGHNKSQDRRYTSHAITAVSGVSSSNGYHVPKLRNRHSSLHDTGVNSTTSDIRSRNEWSPALYLASEETKSNNASSTTYCVDKKIRNLSKYLVRQKNEVSPSRDSFEATIYIPKKSRVGFRSCWIYEKMVVGTFKTFSEAEQMCLAFSPPVKPDLSDVITCEVCKEACGVVMNRKKTCKNCGRWVCPQCSSKKWPRVMLPYTYVLDRSDPLVRVCDTCYDACKNFREALLRGDEFGAKQIYTMGCINLRTPHAMSQNERPVHCAAHGGNLKLLIWLIEDRHCQIFLDAEKKAALGDGSKRSVLAIAARLGNLGMVRYLLAVQKCNIREVTELPALWRIIDCLFKEEGKGRTTTPSPMAEPLAFAIPCSDISFHDPESSYSADIADVIPSAPPVIEEATVPFSAENECVVCFEKIRNCTLVPCGHLACCYECGLNLTHCCVCRQKVDSVIRTFST